MKSSKRILREIEKLEVKFEKVRSNVQIHKMRLFEMKYLMILFVTIIGLILCCFIYWSN